MGLRKWSERFAAGAAGAALLLGFFIVDDSVWPLDWNARRGAATALGAAASAIAALAAYRSADSGGPRRISMIRWASVAAAAGIFAVVSAPHELLFAWVLWSGALEWACAGAAFSEGITGSLAAAAALLTAWRVGPWSGSAVERALSAVPSAVCEAVASRRVELGPTAAGTAALLVFALVAAVRLRSSGARVWLAAVAAEAVVWAFAPLAMPASGAQDATQYFTPLLLICASAAMLIFLCELASPRASAEAPAAPPVRMLPAGAALGLAAGVAFAGVVPWHAAKADSQILIFNRGGFDWDRPVYGRFGGFTGGMFGLLPLYLEREGARLAVLDRDTIVPSDLDGVGLLMMINCPKKWRPDEKQTIVDYVQRGGSLLVLGDHTNVFGLRDGYNTLLDAFGIQFRFDSAYHVRKGWTGCLASMPHALAHTWASGLPGIGIGASLDVRPPAQTLLSARFAFSDAGHAENYVGSFLGDYHYQDGELLGDLPIVATAAVGKGRVVVYGDTSSFQNSSVAYTEMNEIRPLVAWLLEEPSTAALPAVRAIAGAAAAMMILFARRRSRAAIAGAVAAGVLASFSATSAAAQRRWTKPYHTDRSIAVYDNSLAPNVGHYDEGGNTAGALAVAMSRGGLLLRKHVAWDPEAIAGAGVVAFVAPQRPIRDDQAQQLLESMRGGSRVIVAVGDDEADPIRPLLRRLGLDLLPVPLGPLPKERYGDARTMEPSFPSAWPIGVVDRDGRVRDARAGDPELSIAYKYGDHAVVAFRKVGAGGLLLIADSRFFSAQNVEDVSSWSRANMKFLFEISKQYLGLDPDAVKPRFQNPPPVE